MALTKPMFYCPKCDTKNTILLCPRCDNNPFGLSQSVGITEKFEGDKMAEAEMQQASNNLKMEVRLNNVYAKQIWNEAIEACCKNLEEESWFDLTPSQQIRKLKI